MAHWGVQLAVESGVPVAVPQMKHSSGANPEALSVKIMTCLVFKAASLHAVKA